MTLAFLTSACHGTQFLRPTPWTVCKTHRTAKRRSVSGVHMAAFHENASNGMGGISNTSSSSNNKDSSLKEAIKETLVHPIHRVVHGEGQPVDIKHEPTKHTGPSHPADSESTAPVYENMSALMYKNGVPTPNKQALEILGDIPEWLFGSGDLIRNGPGIFEFQNGKFEFSHAFDGIAMLHKFSFEKDKVTYMSNIMFPEIVDAYNRDKGRSTDFLFGQDDEIPPSTMDLIFRNISPIAKNNVNLNVHVHNMRGKPVLASDIAVYFGFDKETLTRDKKPFGFSQFIPNLYFATMSTAHPLVDPKTNEYITFVQSDMRDEYMVLNIPEEGKGEPRIIGSVRDKKAMVHSFFATENYVVIPVWPAYFDLMKALFTRTYMGGMSWDESGPTRFHVLDRKTGKHMSTYVHDPGFCFHTVNAYEEDGNLNLFLCHYDNLECINQLSRKRLMAENCSYSLASLKRYVLPNVAGHEGQVWEAGDDESPSKYQRLPRAVVESVTMAHIDLPEINMQYEQTKQRFVYGGSRDPARSTALNDRVVKINCETKTATYWFEPYQYPGEPTFVPNPSAAQGDEDDGVLLVVVYDGLQKTSYLLVLDAQTMTEQARMYTPHPITLGFHGGFHPAEK